MNDNLHIILNNYKNHVIEEIIQNNEHSGTITCGCGSTFKNMKNLKRHLEKSNSSKRHTKWLVKNLINHMEQSSEEYREICYTINSIHVLDHKNSHKKVITCKCHSSLKTLKTYKKHVHSRKHKEWLFEYIIRSITDEKEDHHTPYKMICDCGRTVYNTNINRHTRGRHHLRIIEKMDTKVSGSSSYIFSHNSNIVCDYCHIPYTIYDTVTVLPCCGKHFHRRCMYNIRIVNNDKKCPTCQKYVSDNSLLTKCEHDTIGKCIVLKNSNDTLLSRVLSEYYSEMTVYLRQLLQCKELIENSFNHIEDLIRNVNDERMISQYSHIVSHYNIHIYPNIIEFVTFIRELMNWIHECRLNFTIIWKNIRPHIIWTKDNIDYVDELNTYYNELWDYITQIIVPLNEENIINQGLQNSVERKENINHSLKRYIFSPSKFDMNSCVICLESFHKGDNVSLTNCRHCFHFDCILENLHYSNDCPLCREQIE